MNLEFGLANIAKGVSGYYDGKERKRIQEENTRMNNTKIDTADTQNKMMKMQIQQMQTQMEEFSRKKLQESVDGTWRAFLTDNSFDTLNNKLAQNPKVKKYFGGAVKFEAITDEDIKKLGKEGHNINYLTKEAGSNRYARKYFLNPKTGMLEYKVVDLHAIRKGMGYYRRDELGRQASIKNGKRDEMAIYKNYEEVVSTKGLNALTAGERVEYGYYKQKFSAKPGERGSGKDTEMDKYKRLLNTPYGQLNKGEKAELHYYHKKFSPVGSPEKAAQDPYYFTKLSTQRKSGKYTGMDWEKGEALYWDAVRKQKPETQKRLYREEFITASPKYVAKIKEGEVVPQKDITNIRILESNAGIQMPQKDAEKLGTSVIFVGKVRHLKDRVNEMKKELYNNNDAFAAVKAGYNKLISDDKWNEKSAREKLIALSKVKIKTRLGMVLSDYLKLVSGTAVPEKEYDRIAALLTGGKFVNFDILSDSISEFGNTMIDNTKDMIDMYKRDYTYKSALAHNELQRYGRFEYVKPRPSTYKATKDEDMTDKTRRVVNNAAEGLISTAENAVNAVTGRVSNKNDKSDKGLIASAADWVHDTWNSFIGDDPKTAPTAPTAPTVPTVPVTQVDDAKAKDIMDELTK